MSNLLQIQNGAKSFADRILMNQCTFAVNEGEHLGVIGPNGAGKSTLFKIIVGLEQLDSGAVVKANNLRIGYLSQEENWDVTTSGHEFLESHCVVSIWDLYRLAHDLGLNNEHLHNPISQLSGGYRMRLKLVHLIGNEPNLMLLDEPTNYLDLETLLVLEQFLLDFSGAFLLISHDREFLRRVTDHTLEIEAGEINKFNGNIDDYFEQKQMLEEQLRARASSIAAHRASVLEFAARFGAKATKAKQAQSRLKRLDRMEQVEMRPLPVRARISLPEPVRTGQLIGEAEKVDLGYGEKIILRNVNVRLKRGDHLGIVGVNGVGKSTLLKAMAGQLAPLNGELRMNCAVGYYAQHVSAALHAEHTVLQAMSEEAQPDITRQEILNLAGSLLFSGDDVQKKVRVLSGGEKSRVALGRILLKRAPCLLLDEPTNHLDFNTVEALTQALANYSGTVVVVSHDRGFVRRVANQILEIRDGSVDLYPGTYDEYVWSLQRGFFSEKVTTPTDRVTRSVQPIVERAENSKERRKTLDKRIRNLEKEVLRGEALVAELESTLAQLSEKLSSVAGASAQSLVLEIQVQQKRLEQVESEWFAKLEEKEQCLKELEQLSAGAP